MVVVGHTFIIEIASVFKVSTMGLVPSPFWYSWMYLITVWPVTFFLVIV